MQGNSITCTRLFWKMLASDIVVFQTAVKARAVCKNITENSRRRYSL